jgi:hypothetical protein
VVNKEVEQRFGEGCDIVTGETCDRYSLNLNILGKVTELHLAFMMSLLEIVMTSYTNTYLMQLGLCQISAYRFFDINILGKAAALHLTLALFCG